MNNHDKAEFAKTLNVTFKAMPGSVAIDDDVLELWWLALQDVTLAEFKAAMLAHVQSAAFAPTIGEIRQRIFPPAPHENALVAMARNHDTPIGALAYRYLRDWLDQPWPELKNRATQFLQRWDDHQRRLREGPLDRHERHYLSLYCRGQDVPYLGGTLPLRGPIRAIDEPPPPKLALADERWPG